jgi:hypothetical protein
MTLSIPEPADRFVHFFLHQLYHLSVIHVNGTSTISWYSYLLH